MVIHNVASNGMRGPDEAAPSAGAGGQTPALRLIRGQRDESADRPSVSEPGRRLLERIRRLPAVDTARVAELRQAIADGRYRVSSRRIAEAIVRDEIAHLRAAVR